MPINKKYLFSSIIIAYLLCMMQIRGSTLLVLLCLMGFMLLLCIGCCKDFTLPILLFFLPWSPILRLSPDSFSFFTFGLVMVCCIGLVKNNFHLKNYAIIVGCALLFLTLLSKLLDENFISFDYLAFLMMLVLFPMVKEETHKGQYDFFQITFFFALGIIIAALLAMTYATSPNVARYIRVDSYLTIIRRCGFYGDPNFYTAQITAVMSSCLVLLLKEKQRSRTVLLSILLILLLYCGFLSASKSFVLITLLVLILWIVKLYGMKKRYGLKLFLTCFIILVGVYVARSEAFGELIEVVTTRFSSTTDMESFTTGRTTVWRNYLQEFLGQTKVFLLGRGFTNVKIAGRSSHNTILQAFYQFGLLGVPFLVYWVRCFLGDAGQKISQQRSRVPGILILLVGVYLPWMAIDILFFDDFFLLQWYTFAACHVDLE